MGRTSTNFHGKEKNNMKDFPLEITPNAIDALREALRYDTQEKLRVGIVRIAIQGGGCSGLQYKLDIDTDTRDDDYVLEVEEGITVVIDGHSATVLRGTTLDYESTLLSAGFKFINPNAKKHCGCGSSFGV